MPSKKSRPPKGVDKWYAVARIREFFAEHPAVRSTTVPQMQRVVGGGDLRWDAEAFYVPPHIIEQAFHLLALSGEMFSRPLRLPWHMRSGCKCGEHRAAVYGVRR